MPSTVPSRYNDEDCPALCPATCGQDEMMCPGGTDPNGERKELAAEFAKKVNQNFDF